MRRRTWLLLPLLVLAFAAAACGGGGDAESTEPDVSTDPSIPSETGALPPSPAPAEPTPPAEPTTPAEPEPEVPATIPANAAPIKKGSPKNRILQLQEALDFLGYSVGEPDGIWGQKTRKAIGDFQKDNGIKVSRVGDKKTINLINKQVKEAAGVTTPAAPPPTQDPTLTETTETTVDTATEPAASED